MGNRQFEYGMALERREPLLRFCPLESRHECDWLDLWRAYLEFYEAEVDERVTRNTWQMIIQPQSPVIGFGAEYEGQLLGFATVSVHDRAWSEAPAAYLEDLFVAEEARGHGVGRCLIGSVLNLGRECGWSTVYWHTRADNHRARILYESFVEEEDVIRYSLPFS
jgi:GNAT superfamily N-acetyltransferase